MEEQIKRNEFLEYGSYNGHLYGLHLNSVNEVIESGKIMYFIYFLVFSMDFKFELS